MCASRTLPITPAHTCSQSRRVSSDAWPWLPICVATFASRAACATRRASQTEWVKRLLAIDMLAPLDGLHGREGVVMIGRRDHHAVNLLHLVQHPAVIRELLRLGILLEDVRRVLLVHVAQGHDVLALHLAQVGPALPADTDAGEVQLLVGRARGAQPRHDAGHGHEGGRRNSCRAQELAAGESGGAAGLFSLHK